MTLHQPRRRIIWLLRGVMVVTILMLWEWQAHQPKAFAVVPLTKVWASLWAVIQSGELIRLALGTLMTVAVGYITAVGVGLPLGLLIARSRWAQHTLAPLVDALNTTPLSIFIPIVGVYLGLGFSGRVFIVFIWSIFPIIENTITGARQTSPALLEMAEAMNASPAQVLQTVILPSALPSILVGLRIALGLAFRSALIAEVLLASANLGWFLNNANVMFDFPRLTAGILFIGILGTLLMRGAEALERAALRRLMPYQPFE